MRTVDDIVSSIDDIVASVVLPPSSNVSLEETIEAHNEKARVIKRGGVLTSKLQADAKLLKDKLSSLEKDRAQVRKDVTKLKEDDTSITTKITKLKTEIRDVQYKLNKTSQLSGITQKERDILKQNKDELHAYKSFTGIRWNFAVPDSVIEGLITNSKKNFVKAFQFDKSMPSKKMRESVWHIIKEAGSESWHDLDEDKENQM